MHRIERIISSWLPDSQSNQLAAAAPRWIEVSAELREVLHRSQAIHQETSGAFDLTTGPSIKLWRETRATGRLPDEQARIQARSGPGMSAIQLTANSARIERTGASLDFGGIGKGFAVEAARQELESRGETCFLIDFDGEIRVERPPPGRSDWVIEIGGAFKGTPLRIRTAMMGISTSGDLHQFVEIDGIRYSHVIDPRTGLGTTTGRQVTVITPEPNEVADALATAGCILEPNEFKAVLEAHHPRASAIIVERIDEQTTITMIGDPPVSALEAP